MRGIYIAACITTVAAVAIFGTIAWRMKKRADGRWLLLACLMVLPMQPLAFYLVRVPLDGWLGGLLGKGSGLYQFLTTFYAPLTEEPAKLVPLLVPAIFRDVRRENFVRYAVAIGLGFGIGELWFIAERVSHDPQLGNLPFYYYGGFFGERLSVCVLHAAFVAVSLRQLRDRFPLGLAGAMALHYFGNFPIFLMVKNAFGWSTGAWRVIVTVWLQLYLLGGILLLAYFSLGKFEPGRVFFGRSRCPGCGAVYSRPFFGLNLGLKRYERCPHCRKWHMISIMDAVKDNGE
jgi:hypothetical protein